MRLPRAIPLVGILAAAAAIPVQSRWSKGAWSTILTSYANGDYAASIKAIQAIDISAFEISLTPDTPDNALSNWERAAPEWTRLGTSPAVVRRRQLIAATVALEIMRAHSNVRPQHLVSLATWACRLVRGHPDRNDAERLWYLASVAVMQETRTPGLLPTKARDLSVSLAATVEDRAEMIAGHLTHAISAFPDEKRFEMAEVLARASATSVTSYYPSPNSMHANELPVKKPPSEPGRALLLADRLAPLPAVERDLQALAANEQVRAEVELNLGYLSMRQQRWDEALSHLDRVTPFTTEALLTSISHYLRGWVYQRTDHRDAAIAEYRAALKSWPRARSISFMLADQLAQAGRQVDAYDVLDAAMKNDVVTLTDRAADPWEQFKHGEARLVATYLTQLREALR